MTRSRTSPISSSPKSVLLCPCVRSHADAAALSRSPPPLLDTWCSCSISWQEDVTKVMNRVFQADRAPLEDVLSLFLRDMRSSLRRARAACRFQYPALCRPLDFTGAVPSC